MAWDVVLGEADEAGGCVIGGRKEVTALSGDSKVSPGFLCCLT